MPERCGRGASQAIHTRIIEIEYVLPKGCLVLKKNDPQFPSSGKSVDQVRNDLNRILERDLTFGSGCILGSMCSKPDSFGARIFSEQLEKNIGDPGLHPALAELEYNTIRTIGDLLHHRDCVGAVVSGGTEANLLALWTAKNRAGKSRREVVLPATAHFSFDKAASLMDIDLVKIPVDRENRVCIDQYRQAVCPRTMALVGIAGTTGLGAVDPLSSISELAMKHELYLHIDAAFGGFVLPFLESAGYPCDQSDFDFQLPGVDSITIDPHKMGRAPIPAGCIIYRSDAIAGHSTTDVTYLAGGYTRQRTIIGTRSGASVAAVWSLIQSLGIEGYTDIVKRCMYMTHWLKDRIAEIEGIETVIEPVINVLGIKPTGMTPERLAEKLRNRGYALSLFPGFLRITLMPHLSIVNLSRFLHVLEEEAAK